MRSKILAAIMAAALIGAAKPDPGWDRLKSLVGS